MGCAVSSMEKEAAERSRKIDRELAMDGEKANREIDVISVIFKSSQYYFQEYHSRVCTLYNTHVLLELQYCMSEVHQND